MASNSKVYTSKRIENSVYEELIPSSGKYNNERMIQTPENKESIILRNNEQEQPNSGGALWGVYDEKEAKNSFQEALSAWRSNPNIQESIAESLPTMTSKTTENEIQTNFDTVDRKRQVPVLSEEFKKNLSECTRITYFEQLQQYQTKENRNI